ncbi:methyltransferase (TIGR00027 family) [Nocardiopsis mwathae]|uniref:S-adenosyl-L-methionine-dependent methyltransferase n=1 Tax=Nocardiopsis mwathae TaxID=1472723 RepID=A0A7W9YLE5_9ACTN|nr:methyltransferase (TIGR00027 family) [Nocardiopsis mwathae]
MPLDRVERGNDLGGHEQAMAFPGGVGLTALMAALDRSAESNRNDRLFEDRLAQQSRITLVKLAKVAGLISTHSPDISAFIRDTVLLRTYYFDRELLDAARHGCVQVVLLGSGLDSRAFRLLWPENIELFEVDRADVFALKDHIIDETESAPACTRIPVWADLRGDWLGALRAAGFNPWRRTVWLLEGLLPHLNQAESDRLMGAINAMSVKGSRLLLDHFGAALEENAGYSEVVDVFSDAGILLRLASREPEPWLAKYGWTAESVDLRKLIREAGRRVSSLLDPHTVHECRNWWMVRATR